METSLKTGFAQILSCCPKKSEWPEISGGLQPPSCPPPQKKLGPHAYVSIYKSNLADIF